MSLTDTRKMLKCAQTGRYAVGAFNVENMEMAQAVIAAAEELDAPVIVQTTSGTLNYAGPRVFAGIVSSLAQDARVPVALHLDHGSSFALAEECVRAGYTSIMIDGSALPFEDNAELSRRVVDMAGDIPVEAELGKVGGKEDDHAADKQYTQPDDAERFVKITGVSSFAPAIGTAHGVYTAAPALDFDRLAEIRRRVDVPLVLHGASGVPIEQVRMCVELGVCKINYATELRIAYTQAIKRYLDERADTIDPKKFGACGYEAVKRQAAARIELLGSAGKAKDIAL